MNSKYTLRTSEQKDAEFLFHVKIEAMKPTSSVSRTTLEYDKELAEYLTKFEPEKVQVIQHEGIDVGRLRVVRFPESIYIGGIQILPKFQGKGIGTAIFEDIIRESELSGVPVTLEVHDVNEKAIYFYKKLGFNEVGKEGLKTLMRHTPKR